MGRTARQPADRGKTAFRRIEPRDSGAALARDTLLAARRRNPGAPGFTLIELLVVIAILALLVSILLPSIAKAKRLAYLVKCTTNLNGFGRAAEMYATENGGWIPVNDYDYKDAYYFWALRLAAQLGVGVPSEEEARSTSLVTEWVTSQDFFHCPGIEASGREEGIDYTANNFNWDAYAYNVKHGNFSHPQPWKWPRDYPDRYNRQARDLAKVRSPLSELLYIAEANQRLNIKQCNIGGPSYCTFKADGKPGGSRMIHPDDMRHDGKTAFVCFDGHVEVRQMTPENFPMSLYVPGYVSPPN